MHYCGGPACCIKQPSACLSVSAVPLLSFLSFVIFFLTCMFSHSSTPFASHWLIAPFSLFNLRSLSPLPLLTGPLLFLYPSAVPFSSPSFTRRFFSALSLYLLQVISINHMSPLCSPSLSFHAFSPLPFSAWLAHFCSLSSLSSAKYVPPHTHTHIHPPTSTLWSSPPLLLFASSSSFFFYSSNGQIDNCCIAPLSHGNAHVMYFT